MKPIKLQATHKDYIWGGKTFETYIRENKGCLGTLCKSEELPILIKLLDAEGNLSVQVHPNNEQTKKWKNQNKKTEPRKIPTCSDGTRLLGSCEYFAVKEIKLSGSKKLIADEKSYHALIVAEGEAALTTKNYAQNIKAGETVFIPAGMGEYLLCGKATVFLTTNQPDYYVGINLGGTNIAAAVIDEDGNIYGRTSRKTNVRSPYEEIVVDMVECAFEATRESGLAFDDIKSVGVSCPSAIDKENGNIEFSNNLDFYNVPIVAHMEALLEKKVYVENDAGIIGEALLWENEQK